MSRNPELDELRRKMAENISQMPATEVFVPRARLREFCEIIGETNPVYRDAGEARRRGFEEVPVPESYFLTLITPLSHELFSRGVGLLLSPSVKGVIHTSSAIEFHRPLYCETPYRLVLGLSSLVRKRGNMGSYLVGTFPHKVLDARGDLVAVDSHVFFLRES
ncbi:MAG: MaoC family dehydratase N-terminal domain-containing protein [bacterium]